MGKEVSKVENLHSEWQGHEKESWGKDVNNYIKFISRCLTKAELLLGYDVAQEGLSFFPKDVTLRRIFAVTLNRMEMSEEAKIILLELLQDGAYDEETLGNLASSFKNIARKLQDSASREENFKMAIEYYQKAYIAASDSWHKVNESTIEFVLGNTEKAKGIATDIAKELKESVEASKDKDYWDVATLGESYVVLENYPEAKKYLKMAVDVSGRQIGYQIATRKNLSLLYSSGKVPTAEIEEINAIFTIPSVVVFSGHMIDHPTGNEVRFPSWIEEDVRKIIASKIKNYGKLEVYTSAACGADIIFIEEVLKIGGKVNIVLPCSKELFIKKSVSFQQDTSWEERFNKIINSNVNLMEITNIDSDHLEVPFDFANQLIYGLGKMKAWSLRSSLIPLVVFNKKSKLKEGGTASVVSFLKSLEENLEIIDLGKILEDKKDSRSIEPTLSTYNTQKDDYKFDAHIMGLLYADTVNYSKLSDYEMMVFGKRVLTFLETELENKKYGVAEHSTWGDAFFLSFKNIKETGYFALTLMDFINNFDWKSVGINQKIQLRMALHAGVVYSYENPITKNIIYNGINVCRAARMESITPPGRVFCSQEFAAACESLNVEGFHCSYVGQKLMPKEFGKFPTYLLRRT